MVHVKLGRKFRFAVNKSTIKLHGKFLGLHFYGLVSMHPRVQTMGLTNLLVDNQLVMFIDYDNVFLYRVLKEVRMLQREFDIGTAVVISTGEDVNESKQAYGNYHVIALGKMRYHELLDALGHTSCDRNFLRVPEYFNGRYHVLRIAPKYDEQWRELRDRPYLRNVLWSKTKRVCSLGIYKFLCKYYDMPPFPSGLVKPTFDKFNCIRLLKYQTTEGGWSAEMRRILKLGRKNKV